MKKYLFAVISIIIALSLCSCSSSSFLNIESGFSQRLTDLLSEKYELNIPDSAEFVSGYFDRAFRDPSVNVCFTVREHEFEKLFGDNWKKDSHTNYSSLFSNEWSFEIADTYVYSKELYTALVCSEAENGIIKCAFTGRHPGEYFK